MHGKNIIAIHHQSDKPSTNYQNGFMKTGFSADALKSDRHQTVINNVCIVSNLESFKIADLKQPRVIHMLHNMGCDWQKEFSCNILLEKEVNFS
jgi:hypothetical protein